MTTKEDIKAALWRGANTFRGQIDAANYKDYVLSMLFVKYLTDTYAENLVELQKKYPDEIRLERAKSRLPFVLKQEQTFDYLYDNRYDAEIGQKINAALRAIEDSNIQLNGVFRNVDFNSQSNLGNQKQKITTLRNLLEDFRSLDLRPSKIEVGEGQIPADVLGDAFEYINISEALKHPNWLMGSKITIDSATMINKGLELIEARYLFDMEPDKLDVIIHPESIVHSYITFTDGSTIAQMGKPDMKTPIAVALGYPERICSLVEPVDMFTQKSLTFLKPDLEKFKCLKIAMDVLQKDSNALMTAMNAANEESVKSFLKGSIAFQDIPYVIEDVLAKADITDAQNILEAEENIIKYQKFAAEIISKQ